MISITLQVIHWEEDHEVAEKSKIELTNGEGFFWLKDKVPVYVNY